MDLGGKKRVRGGEIDFDGEKSGKNLDTLMNTYIYVYVYEKDGSGKGGVVSLGKLFFEKEREGEKGHE